MPETITLFSEKQNCCGCGACADVCPRNAITMQEDDFGFRYPAIDTEKCVSCRLCQRACFFQNKEVTNEPVKTFAAALQNDSILRRSASGGAFAALALKCIESGGIVIGAAFDKELKVKHIAISSKDKLPLLQGSKYVQSDTSEIFKKTKQLLLSGKKVLFSGTPCQVAGLYGYLGKKYDHLVTVDLICHGVPNQRMFGDYIRSLGRVKRFSFRDKSIGWGINGSAIIEKNGTDKKMILWGNESPYLYYFSHGEIYRDSCYSCKYACSHRPADITVGDFWGIEKQHPEYLKAGGFNTDRGLSCAVANTLKGLDALNNCKDIMDICNSDFAKAAAGNTQLRKPSSFSGTRMELLSIYSEYGWSAVEEHFNKNIGFRRYSSRLKSMMPKKLKTFLKRIK